MKEKISSEHDHAFIFYISIIFSFMSVIFFIFELFSMEKIRWEAFLFLGLTCWFWSLFFANWKNNKEEEYKYHRISYWIFTMALFIFYSLAAYIGFYN